MSEGWGRSSAVARWLWEVLLLSCLSLAALGAGGRMLKDLPASPQQESLENIFTSRASLLEPLLLV